MTTVRTLDDQRTMTDSVRKWWSTVDPFTPLVGLVSLLIYVLNGFGGYLGRDLGLYVYAGQMVADGEPPYVAILNRAGPLAHLLPGLGVSIARVFGFDDVLGARLLFCAFAVGAVCATYMVGRDLFTSRVVGLVTAATMLTFDGFTHYASNGPREKTFMVLCLVWVMWCAHRQRWLTAGVFIALATLTWQPAFLLMLIITVISILLTSDRRIGSLGRVMVGGLIPTAICALYFVVVGAFKDFLDGFFLINAQYTEAVPFSRHPRGLWRAFEVAYGVSLYFLLVGMATLLTLTVVTLLVKSRRQASNGASLIAIGAAAAWGIAWTYHDINGWPDLFVLLPFGAVGIGALAHEIVRHVPAKVALSLAVTWVVLGTAVATAYAAHSAMHGNTALSLERKSVETVFDNLPAGSTLQSIEAPQSLVLSGKTNPSRIQMFGAGFDDYVDETYPGGLKGFGEGIGRESPTVLAVQGRVPPWLSETVAIQYQRVGAALGWGWYVNVSVGAKAISALTTKLHDKNSTTGR
jgi:hypothetical protein